MGGRQSPQKENKDLGLGKWVVLNRSSSLYKRNKKGKNTQEILCDNNATTVLGESTHSEQK